MSIRVDEQEFRLELLHRRGVALRRRGEILAWLGSVNEPEEPEPRSGPYLNARGDVFITGLTVEDVAELRAPRVWIGSGANGDLVVGPVGTARGWGVLTVQTRYVETRFLLPRTPLTPDQIHACLPNSHWTTGAGPRLWTAPDKFPVDVHRDLVARVPPGRDGRIDWTTFEPRGDGWERVTVPEAVETLRELLQAPLDAGGEEAP